MEYPHIISYNERLHKPSASDGTTSTFVGIFNRCKKSANCAGPTCFIMDALAQFNENASAPAIVTCGMPLHFFPAGTQPLPGKNCASLSTTVSGVNPRSSIACVYNKGLIVDPTCLFVFKQACSSLYDLKPIPPTHALTSPVAGSVIINAHCIICLQYLMESSGVIAVSFSRLLFQAKIFIGVFFLKLSLISFSLNPSSAIFCQRSLSFMYFSR